MAGELKGKRVAALVAKGFEQSELVEPKTALEAAGATVHIVSPESGTVRGWNESNWGDEVRVDVRQGTDRRLYADRITLLSAGGAAAAGIHTVQGTVERFLPERGLLELRLVNSELLTVYVPESSSQATRSRLARIREGDVVSIEGERLDANRMELVAFR